MPGFQLGNVTGVGETGVNYRPVLLGKSMTGTGTPPAATLKHGDVVCLSSHSAVGGSSLIVARMLLAADKTANYEDGSGNVCGIFGVYLDADVDTNSSGLVVAGSVGNGGVIFSMPSDAASYALDKSALRAQGRVAIFDDTTLWRVKLASGTASHANLQGKAGITISTTNGVTTYTANTSDAVGISPFIIEDFDRNDTTYVYLRCRRAFQQAVLPFVYTAQ